MMNQNKEKNVLVLEFTEKDLKDFSKSIDRRIILYNYIYKLIYQQKRTVIIVITGKRGTGKSYLALKLAFGLDQDFRAVFDRQSAEAIIKERVVSNPADYIKVINNPNLHRGNVVIMDEAGIGIPAREWQSVNNKAISYLTQIFRHKGLIVLLTVPDWSFVDVHVREAIDVKITTLRVDFKQGWNICKVQEVVKDEEALNYNDKIKFYYFTVGNMKIKRNRFKKVNTLLANAYERYATQFKEGMEKDLEETVSRQNEDPDDLKKKKYEELLEMVVKSPRLYSRRLHGETVLNARAIYKKLKCSRDMADRLAEDAYNKLRDMNIEPEKIEK